ncbi:MAG: RNA polymerase sigma factor RpoH [Deltaproteobacteria bacterium]|nr:MAG: RNA polymerase sigma factor RpoH [Deltaproteobacteria bacterium]
MKTKSIPTPTGSLEKYLQEINNYPLLKAEEEETLARRWVEEQDVEAAHRLTTSNLRFVVKISYEYRRYGIKLADLIQEGNIGLIMAIKKFDPDRGVRLISYAVWWIRAQIQNYILQSWRLVKIGTTQAQRKLFYKLEKTKRMLARIHGGAEFVKRKDVAEALNVKESLVEEMEQRLGAQEMSIDGRYQMDGEEGRSLTEILPDVGPSPEEQIGEFEYEEMRKNSLYEAMGSLSEREQLIIRRRRLVDDPETLSEIGKYLGITRERVRQLEARALRKLRTFLSEEHLELMVPYEENELALSQPQ